MQPITTYLFSLQEQLCGQDVKEEQNTTAKSNQIQSQIVQLKKNLSHLGILWQKAGKVTNDDISQLIYKINNDVTPMIQALYMDSNLNEQENKQCLSTLNSIKKYFEASISILENSIIYSSLRKITNAVYPSTINNNLLPTQWMLYPNELNELEALVFAKGSKQKFATKMLTISFSKQHFSVYDRNGNDICKVKVQLNEKLKSKTCILDWTNNYFCSLALTNKTFVSIWQKKTEISSLELIQGLIDNDIERLEWNPWTNCISRIRISDGYKIVEIPNLWFKIISPTPWQQHHFYLKTTSSEILWKYGKYGKISSLKYTELFQKSQTDPSIYAASRESVVNFLKRQIVEYLKSRKELRLGEPRNLDVVTLRKKALDNIFKAYTEKLNVLYSSLFTEEDYLASDFYLNNILSPLYEPELKLDKEEELKLSYSSTAMQGVRKTMEDVVLLKDLANENSTLMAVFDGHCGDQAAQIASYMYEKNFELILKSENNNVFNAFEITNNNTQKAILNKVSSGTTAVACYIDKTDRLCYVSTLGDSEAWLFRKIYNNAMSLYYWRGISLSPIRNYKYPKEISRVLSSMQISQEEWQKDTSKHGLYFPAKCSNNPSHKNIGIKINLSRSFEGNPNIMGTREDPGVIHKAKFGLFPLQDGDILLIACDGFWNHVPLSEIIKVIQEYEREKDPSVTLSQKLANCALNEFNSTDNVSVIAARIE